MMEFDETKDILENATFDTVIEKVKGLPVYGALKNQIERGCRQINQMK